MFVTSTVMGVIVSLSGGGATADNVMNADRRKGAEKFADEAGVTCQGPLLRDITVLVLVCVVNLSYLKRGIVDYGFVYALLSMYGAYVLLVLGADAYYIFYHDEPLVCCEDGMMDGEDTGLAASPINTEQTPLTLQEPIKLKRHRHRPTHSIDTVIEAMSNYSRDPGIEASKAYDESQCMKISPREAAVSNGMTRTASGWALNEEDSTEPLVIFHPSNEGLLFLHAGKTPLSPLSTQREESGYNLGEALSENINEFKDHWHDFFSDIYHNEENSILNVVFLSVELPFTIARKVCVSLPVLYLDIHITILSNNFSFS